MSVEPRDGGEEYGTVGVGAVPMERYAAVELETGAVVIYDRDDEDAWFQSASAIGLEFMR